VPMISTVISQSGIHPVSPKWLEVRLSLSLFSHSSISYIIDNESFIKIVLLTFFLFLNN